MIRKMRPRYYCEHCGKGSGSPSHMTRHERGCTANPNRVCGLCELAGKEQLPIEELVSTLINQGLAFLQAFTTCCPTCTLAAIRQSKKQRAADPENGDFGFRWDFDYRKELAGWWAEWNTGEYDREVRSLRASMG